jgi:hypothetical protein
MHGKHTIKKNACTNGLPDDEHMTFETVEDTKIGIKVLNRNSMRFVGFSSSSSSFGTTTRSWVSTCSTIAEHSQQDGFTECRYQRHVKPQLGGEPGI